VKFITELLSGVAAFFRLQEKRHDVNNAPDIKANQSAARDSTIRDTSAAAVATNDLDAIRKQAAE